VCYVLYVASPLTLSEVRSMLPAGMSAHALAPDDDRRLRRSFRPARTVVSILVGPCSCDLVLPRDPVGHTEEAALRARYAAARLSRKEIIRAIDAHRALADPDIIEPPDWWRRALAAFVAEHARNAGPTVYWLQFVPGDASTPPPEPPAAARTVGVGDVLAAPGEWLTEGAPIRVVR
jgi:hypothetical protein